MHKVLLPKHFSWRFLRVVFKAHSRAYCGCCSSIYFTPANEFLRIFQFLFLSPFAGLLEFLRFFLLHLPVFAAIGELFLKFVQSFLGANVVVFI